MLIPGGLRNAITSTTLTRREEAGWAAVLLAAPTIMKFALDGWLTSVPPFLTYFPAVTIAALVLGMRWGMAVLITSAILSDYFFLAPMSDWSVSLNDFVVLVLFLLGGTLIVLTAGTLRRSVHKLHASAAREQELNAELKHRVNNNLLVVQALAKQTARSRPSVDEFYDAFSQRLHALREAHDVLSSTDWMSCDLPRLAERGVKAFQHTGAISFEGPGVVLPPEACVPLTLALHELGANALQHGALSTGSGRISVHWFLEGAQLVLRWVERFGPPVQPPTRSGMGSRLLRPQHGLDGVTVEYLPEGLSCTITIANVRAA